MKNSSRIKNIYSLAHYIDSSDNYKENIISNIVLNILANSESPLDLQNIIKNIKKNFNFKNIYEDDILKILKNLEDSVSKIDKKYSIKSAELENIKKQKENFDFLEKKVFTSFLSLIKENEDINEDESVLIKEDLKEFVLKLFLNHGVSTKRILEGKTNTFQNIEHYYPKNRNDYILNIEKKYFREFLKPNSNSKNEYLLHIIDLAYSYLSINIDSSISNKIKEHMKGTSIYLDTNFMFRLLNLQGESRYKKSKKLIEICKEFEFDIKITEKSIEELGEIIKYYSNILEKNPMNDNFYSVAYSINTSQDYITTYWKRFNEENISIKEYNSYYRKYVELIKQEGIDIEYNINDSNDIENRAKYYVKDYRRYEKERNIEIQNPSNIYQKS